MATAPALSYVSYRHKEMVAAGSNNSPEFERQKPPAATKRLASTLDTSRWKIVFRLTFTVQRYLRLVNAR